MEERKKRSCMITCSQRQAVHMSAALVHSTCADNCCFALDAAFMRSTCFQCSRLRMSRFTRPFDSSMFTSTRAHSDTRTIYSDTAEHARLFKSISSVQRYSLQRSMRANMRSAPCARFMQKGRQCMFAHECSTCAQHMCRQFLCP